MRDRKAADPPRRLSAYYLLGGDGFGNAYWHSWDEPDGIGNGRYTGDVYGDGRGDSRHDNNED